MSYVPHSDCDFLVGGVRCGRPAVASDGPWRCCSKHAVELRLEPWPDKRRRIVRSRLSRAERVALVRSEATKVHTTVALSAAEIRRARASVWVGEETP